jgi:hypothetical protein
VARQTLILAASPREGGRYAKLTGMRPSRYRVVHDASQIKGIQHADVHILPSFAKTIQRHAVLAALQHGYRIEYFYVDPADLPTLDDRAADRQADELGELNDDVLEAAYAEHAAFDSAGWRAARSREKILAMTDEEIAELLQKPLDEATAVELVQAIQEKPKPRAPRQTKAATPAVFD